VAIAIGVAPATAGAASVGYANGTITYSSGVNETNRLTVSPWGFALKVTDVGSKGNKAIAVTAGTGCWQVSANSAACAAATATLVNVLLGDGNDTFDGGFSVVATTVSGGAGDDTLHGGPGADTLDGGIGNDTFDSRDTASDTLVCGDGIDGGNADVLDSIPGDCEAVQGGPAPPSTDPNPIAPITDPVTDPVAGPTTTDPAPGTEPSDGPQNTATPAANSVPASIPSQTVSLSASGVARVRVECPADSGGCSGAVTIELPTAGAVKRTGNGKLSAVAAAGHRAPLKIGRSKFKAAAGTAVIVPVRLSKRGRQRIVRGRRARARIVVTTRKADGSTSVAAQDVTIAAKRRPSKRKGGRS
jgi:hypothetical protein